MALTCCVCVCVSARVRVCVFGVCRVQERIFAHTITYLQQNRANLLHSNDGIAHKSGRSPTGVGDEVINLN